MTPWPNWCLPSQTKSTMPLTLPSDKIVSSSKCTIQSSSSKSLTWSYLKTIPTIMFESRMEIWADNYSVFEAILQGSRFEHGSRLRLVVVRHDHFSGAFIGIQWNGFVRHHFNDELDESSVAANLYIPQSVVTHQLRVIASRDHSEANEWDVGRWHKFLQIQFPVIMCLF